MREMNMMDIPSHSHLQGINVVTYCSVVPMHAEMVVRKDIGRSVDIMQGQPHCGHHSLTWRSAHHHYHHHHHHHWPMLVSACPGDVGKKPAMKMSCWWWRCLKQKHIDRNSSIIVITCWGESHGQGRLRRSSCSPRPRCPSWPRRWRRSPGPSPWWHQGGWWPSWLLTITWQGPLNTFLPCCLKRRVTSKCFQTIQSSKLRTDQKPICSINLNFYLKPPCCSITWSRDSRSTETDNFVRVSWILCHIHNDQTVCQSAEDVIVCCGPMYHLSVGRGLNWLLSLYYLSITC